MKAKDFLKKGYKLNELIEANKEELERLKALASSISSPVLSDMPKSPSRNTDAPYVKYVHQIIELEKLIEEEIEKYLSIKKTIRKAISEVEDSDEKLLLQYRYIIFLTWDEICERLNVSLRTVHRIHASALQHIVVPIDIE